jgi:hypothetical protein
MGTGTRRTEHGKRTGIPREPDGNGFIPHTKLPRTASHWKRSSATFPTNEKSHIVCGPSLFTFIIPNIWRFVKKQAASRRSTG